MQRDHRQTALIDSKVLQKNVYDIFKCFIYGYAGSKAKSDDEPKLCYTTLD